MGAAHPETSAQSVEDVIHTDSHREGRKLIRESDGALTVLDYHIIITTKVKQKSAVREVEKAS